MDGDTAFFTDGEEYYGFNYNDIDKGYYREYSEVKPSSVEKDEDGGLSFYYDDDSWEVDEEIIEKYVKDYMRYKPTVSLSGDDVNYGDGRVFYIHEGDNGWYESLMEVIRC